MARPARSAFVVAVPLVTGAYASPADAFCRATTCDPASETCRTDAHGCPIDGVPLAWAGPVSVWVDPRGSRLRKIDADGTAVSLAKAFQQWTTAPCAGGGAPHLDATVHSGTATPPDGTTVTVTFRDSSWPYDPSFGAITHLEFEEDTGFLLAAKTEFNSADHALSLDPSRGVDFDAVVAHEMGHVIGLGHTDVAGATMEPEARAFGSVALASLETDDERGVCGIYENPIDPAAGEEEVQPPSCSVAAFRGPGERRGFAIAMFAAAALAFLRRRATGGLGCAALAALLPACSGTTLPDLPAPDVTDAGGSGGARSTPPEPLDAGPPVDPSAGPVEKACVDSCEAERACGRLVTASCDQNCVAGVKLFKDHCQTLAAAETACQAALSCADLDAYLNARRGDPNCGTAYEAFVSACAINGGAVPTECAHYCSTAVDCKASRLDAPGCEESCLLSLTGFGLRKGSDCASVEQRAYDCFGGLSCPDMTALANGSIPPSCADVEKAWKAACQ